MPAVARRPRIDGPPQRRFERYAKKGPSCWIWTGPFYTNGYGRISIKGRDVLVHRFAYMEFVGPIPEGRQIDHVCRNRACVNPKHLRLATNKQNNEHKGVRRDNRLGLRGVGFNPRTGKYRTRVQHNGREYRAGEHETAELAAEAVRQLRIRLFTHNEYDRKGG